MNPTEKPLLVIVGQTPPPWHGQAVCTKLLFDASWDGFDVRTVRMAFSEEMQEIGRFQWRKLLHIASLRKEIARITRNRRDGVLLYPPASPNWVPVLRDLMILPYARKRFAHVVHIFHAGGLGEWAASSSLRGWLVRHIYGGSSLSLEVAKEQVPPHEVIRSRSWVWTPYGVEAPSWQSNPRTYDKPFEILFVGSLQEGKGVIQLLDTAILLRQRHPEKTFRFRVVGRWFSRDFEIEARAYCSRHQLDEIVEFAGQLTGTAKWQAYTSADLFFFPTHYESEAFPLVLIEALACGLPVVTTRWRGIPDLVHKCPVATLCSIRSPDQFAAAIEDWRLRLKQDDTGRTAALARSYYEQRYRPVDFLGQIGVLIKNLISQPVKGSAVPMGGSDRDGFTAFRKTVADRIPLRVLVYLADQNPGYDRSFGISRMSHVVMGALKERCKIDAVVSRTSQRPPADVRSMVTLPWGTRRKWVRFLTDHLHPLFRHNGPPPEVHYFPKGYLPWLHMLCRPSVVTIHDTIILHDADHYPRWRRKLEYYYWALMLKHTLLHADRIMTVSEISKRQIEAHMDRLMIPHKPVTVTYEPCAYESLPQPVNPAKRDYVLHLASVEPHKRTAHLIRWWHEAELAGKALPELHLVGAVPHESVPVVAASKRIVKHPFLEDSRLRDAYQEAKMLILPSEIEGFGLPALEAYYLGTPVCYVKGTSVEEVLAPATIKGGFTLDRPASLWAAMAELGQMSADEVHACGLKLRETYAAEKVAVRMMEVFEEVRQQQGEDAQR